MRKIFKRKRNGVNNPRKQQIIGLPSPIGNCTRNENGRKSSFHSENEIRAQNFFINWKFTTKKLTNISNSTDGNISGSLAALYATQQVVKTLTRNQIWAKSTPGKQGQSRVMPRRRQSHHWIHAADRTIATKWQLHGTQHNRIYSTTRPNVMWIKCWGGGGISLPTVDFFLFIPPASSVKEIGGENFLCPSGSYMTSCQLQVQSPQRSRRRHDGQQFELQQRPDACRGDGTQLRDEWNWMVPRLVAGGICGLQTRVDKSRDYGETTRVSTTFSCCSSEQKNRTEPHSEISQSIELLLQ